MVKNITNDRDPNLILHLIKSCENYALTEKESLETIDKILDKDVSRRTYYNYKKKLYDKEMIQKIKGTIYDTQALRCLILDIEDADKEKSVEADKQVAEQLPDRPDIFHDTERYKRELDEVEKTKSMVIEFENQKYESIQKLKEIPKNAKIRKEYIKCGKVNCNDCQHGPYYYAYWKDTISKKLKKKYLGSMDPR